VNKKGFAVQPTKLNKVLIKAHSVGPKACSLVAWGRVKLAKVQGGWDHSVFCR
jgi:hypothetical protein